MYCEIEISFLIAACSCPLVVHYCINRITGASFCGQKMCIRFAMWCLLNLLDLFKRPLYHGDTTFTMPVSGFGEAIVTKNNLVGEEVFYIRKDGKDNKHFILLGVLCSLRDAYSPEEHTGNLPSAHHVKGTIIQQCIPCILLETLAAADTESESRYSQERPQRSKTTCSS